MTGGGSSAGVFGPLPTRRGLLDLGLDAGILTRWDRWWDLASASDPPPSLDQERPAWRLVARGGLFSPEPLAGCFRLGRDRSGRVYPFAVLRPGQLPDPSDPWFDAAEALARDAIEGRLGPSDVERSLGRLPMPRSLAPPFEEAAVLWRDDWEVQELRFATARDLAGFSPALAARSPLGRGEAA